MPDDVDIAQDRYAPMLDDNIRAVQQRAKNIPQGRAGECDACGEESGRLIFNPHHGWVCAPCRDKRRLP